MNCKTARSLFDEHVDGTLGAARARELATHVAACVSCREELAGLEHAVGVLAIGEVGATPPEHVASVMAAVRNAAREESPRVDERRERRVLPWWWLVVSHVAAAAIVAAVVWGLVRERGAAPKEPGPIANEGEAVVPAPEQARDDRTENHEVASTPRYVFVPYELRVVQRAPERDAVAEANAAELAVAEAARRAAAERVQLAALALEKRVANAGAALAFALDRGARGVERLARAAEEHTTLLAEQLAVLRANQGDGEVAALAPAATELAANEDEQFVQRGPLAITRDAGGVVLSLRGDLDEVVPALIAQLDSADADVRAAVRRRLEACARELGVPPPTAAVAATDSPWYRSDRGRVADEHTGRTGEDVTVGTAAWRDWWSDARSAARPLP